MHGSLIDCDAITKQQAMRAERHLQGAEIISAVVTSVMSAMFRFLITEMQW